MHADPAPLRGETALALEIPGDGRQKPASIARVLQAIRALRPVPPEEERRIRLCLDEAIENAVVWGSGRDPGRTVRIRVFLDGARWGATVTDEGEGFRPESLPDYGSDRSLWDDHGRGLLILRSYLSEVAYFDGGRTLWMVSR